MSLTEDELAALEPTYANALKHFPPKLLGPTWRVNDDGSWYLPEKTLGWEVLAWCSTWLVHPDTGDRWRFTPEQARFILWWYAVDNTGAFLKRRGVLQRLKGWGKDPIAVAIGLAELVGPVMFDGWKPNGQPKGKARRTSLVQIVAVNKDQGMKNAMHMAPAMLTQAAIDEYNLIVQVQVIQVKGRPGTRLEVLSSSPKGAEGNRAHFAILDETHHWVPSRGGEELYNTVYDNTTKVKGRILCVTNAYVPGEDSVAEKIRYAVDQWLAGLAVDPGWLYDSIEAHPDAPFDTRWGPHIVKMVAGDSHWVPYEDAAQNFSDLSRGINRLRRMWYNQVVASDDALYSEAEWDAIRAIGMTGTKADLARGDEIVLGFDGGKTDDATALVAIRLRDKLMVPLAVWSSPAQKKRGDNSWQVDAQEVSGEVHLAFFNYDVKAFYADVAEWEPYIRLWSDDYRERLYIKASDKSAIGFDMRGNQAAIVYGHEAFMASIAARTIFHNGDPILRKHALNTRSSTDNRYGVSFRKESAESPNKVDVYAAAFLAFLAMNAVLESDKKDPSKVNRTLIQH